MIILSIALLVLKPTTASAHQPRIVENNPTIIINPEVSQAFYGQLQGKPQEFIIKSTNAFKLYVGLLVPKIPSAQKNYSVRIQYLHNRSTQTIAVLDGAKYHWTPFFEDFAKDYYWWGPEFKGTDSIKGKELDGKLVPAGKYIITVYNSNNTGKYVLVTGFLEVFPTSEIINATITVPRIKAQFFNYPLSELVTSPYVSGYLLGIYTISFVVAFILKLFLRRLLKKSVDKQGKNLGIIDRLLRILLAAVLFILAVATTWNPLIFFVSGFSLFEGLSSWCIFYHALGRNTCSVR